MVASGTRTAGIILIGNEILSGKIADLNAAYLCRELRGLGVDVRRITVIPDDVEVIGREVAEFHKTYDHVFTSGGVGPTHDDVTMEGIARGLGISVVRHPDLVARLRVVYADNLNEARLRMAEVPEGAELLAGELRFPAVAIRNIYILPGIPEIFREKFEAIKERFRGAPFHLRTIYVRIGEGALAAHLNGMLRTFPDLLCGSYPKLSHPEYKVRVTLESQDSDYLARAFTDLMARIPPDAVVRVE